MSMKKDKDGCYINKSAMRFDEWEKGDLVFQCRFGHAHDSGNKLGKPYIVTDINKEEKDDGESIKAKWPHLWNGWTNHVYPKDRDGSRYYWALLTSVGTDKDGNIKHVFVRVSDTMKDDVKWYSEKTFRGNLDYEWSKAHLVEARLKMEEEKKLLDNKKNAQKQAMTDWRYKAISHIAEISLTDIKRDPLTTWNDAVENIHNAMEKNEMLMCRTTDRPYLKMEQDGKSIELEYKVTAHDWTEIIGPVPDYELIKDEPMNVGRDDLGRCQYERSPQLQITCRLVGGIDSGGEFRWYIETRANDCIGPSTTGRKYMIESEVTEAERERYRAGAVHGIPNSLKEQE